MMIYSIKRECDGTIHSSYKKLEDAKKVIKHLAIKGGHRVSDVRNGRCCLSAGSIVFDIEESCLHDSKATDDLIRSN